MGRSLSSDNLGRIAILGAPRAGKTTLAAELGGLVRHTDDLVATHDWSGASLAASRWFDEPGAWVVEGVAVPRAARKWLARNETGKPFDHAIVLRTPRQPLTPGQHTMASGCETVWAEIEPELRRRGVTIEHRN